MITLNVEQGSPEWLAARVGLPTASGFSKCITPTGKASTQAGRYLARLTAEWFLGESLDDFKSGYMERGSTIERQAKADYSFRNDVEVVPVGLCLRDDQACGCSPDGLVGEEGLIECKCLSAENHMMYVLEGPPDDYVVQVQGQLWITGRKWCDLLCYHPSLPRVMRRYERDEKFIAAMAVEVEKLIVRLAGAKARLADDKAAYDAKFTDEELPASLS